jgi:hypothetical protein
MHKNCIGKEIKKKREEKNLLWAKRSVQGIPVARNDKVP